MMRIDLPVSGWPILSAAMQTAADLEDVGRFAAALCRPSRDDLAGVLQALAAAADEEPAARRLHQAQFERHAQALREGGFLSADLLVPAASGRFERSDRLALNAVGVSGDHRLNPHYATALAVSEDIPIARSMATDTGDLADRLRAALEPLRGVAPDQAVLFVLALLGRRPDIAGIAREWEGQRSFADICVDLDAIGARLEVRNPTIAERQAELRFDIAADGGGMADVLSAAGTSCRVPLAGDGATWLKTPTEWADADYALQDRYSALVFDRAARLGKAGVTRLVGVACDKLDEHYLATHRPTPSDQASYTVSEAMTDYWLEHGHAQSSSVSIRARLKLLSRFIDAETAAGRLSDPFSPDQVDDRFLERFRAWSASDPIIARRKNERGEWIDGARRKRAPSTTEESVIQLKAALNHAFNARRLRYVPPLKHKTRDQVTPERGYRLSVAGLAELLDYSLRGAGNYAGHADRLVPLRRYVIAGMCTLARPDAIFDMNVLAERGQWMKNERRFNLNPQGRIQTKKLRPVLPVVDLLQSWLSATDEWFVCAERPSLDDGLQEEIVKQVKVGAIRSGWAGASRALGIPAGWGPKLIRHSMATILANRRVDLVELELAMGHRVLGKTTSRYAIFDPDYLGTISAGIEDVVADLLRQVSPELLVMTEERL